MLVWTQQPAPIAVVDLNLKQVLNPLLDLCRNWDFSVYEYLLAPRGQDSSTVLLHDHFPSPMNPNDGVAPPVIDVLQINNQPLGTTPYGEEASTLLGSSNHVECEEVLDPASIRNEPVTEGLKTQDNAPTSFLSPTKRGPYDNGQKVANEACEGELQPKGST